MPPVPSVRRYQDIKLIYDFDFEGQGRVVRQRIYKNSDGTVQTPVTELTLVRQYTGNTTAPRGINFEPRHLNSCFNNPNNDDGTSRLKAIIPYRPTEAEFKQHIREILTYPGVVNASYMGEQHNATTKPFIG